MSKLKPASVSRPAAQTIFVRYVIFAVVAGLANLLTQETIVVLAPGAMIMLSILFGTGAGFVVKYYLDKRWIFLDSYDGHAAEARKIFIYGVFSVATTIIFWGVEVGFWSVWMTAEAKYAGAILGLMIGNAIKYALDRRYVFAKIQT